MQRDYYALANDERIRPFLDLLSQAEGTTSHGYQTMFGGGKIGDLSDHPRKKLPFTQTDGKRNYSSAAGKYQIIEPTWDRTSKALGLNDFSPMSQDVAALYLMDEAGALDDVANGNFDDAVDKLGKVWASLPTSPYPQPKMNDQQFDTLVAQAYGEPVLPQTMANYSGSQPNTNTQEEKPMASMLEQTLAKIAPTADALGDLRQTPDFANNPELLELLSKKGRQDASMLPLAVGALLSGDKQFQQLGAAMYQSGQEGRNPIKMGDYGFIDPSNGGFVENPMAAANNANADIATAANLSGEMTRAEAELERKLSSDQAIQAFKALNGSIAVAGNNRADEKFQFEKEGRAVNLNVKLNEIDTSLAQVQQKKLEAQALASDSQWVYSMENAGKDPGQEIARIMQTLNSQEQSLVQSRNRVQGFLQSSDMADPQATTALPQSLNAMGQSNLAPAPVMPKPNTPPGMPAGLPQTMGAAGLAQPQPNFEPIPVPAAPPMNPTVGSPNGQTQQPDVQQMIDKAASDGFFTKDRFMQNLQQEFGDMYQPKLFTKLPDSEIVGVNVTDARPVYKKGSKRFYRDAIYDPASNSAKTVYYEIPDSMQMNIRPLEDNEKLIAQGAEELTDIRDAERLIKIIEEKPHLFSPKNRTTSILLAPFGNAGASLAGDIVSRDLSEEDNRDRIEVGQKGAELINKFYGKQVTGGESSMASTIFPRMDQNPKIVKAALQAIVNRSIRLEGVYGNAPIAAAMSRAGWVPSDFKGISKKQRKELQEIMGMEID